MQFFFLIYSMLTHENTRFVMWNIFKFTFDVLFASILVGVSIILSLITCGGEFARKKVVEHRRKEEQVCTF